MEKEVLDTSVLTCEHVLRVHALNSMMEALESLAKVDEEHAKGLIKLIEEVHADTERFYN